MFKINLGEITRQTAAKLETGTDKIALKHFDIEGSYKFGQLENKGWAIQKKKEQFFPRFTMNWEKAKSLAEKLIRKGYLPQDILKNLNNEVNMLIDTLKENKIAVFAHSPQKSYAVCKGGDKFVIEKTDKKIYIEGIRNFRRTVIEELYLQGDYVEQYL